MTRKRKRDRDTQKFTGICLCVGIIAAVCAFHLSSSVKDWKGSVEGRLHEKPRDSRWFDEFPMDKWDHNDFVNYYRVPMSLFRRLVQMFGGDLEQGGSTSRDPVSGARIVAACLRRLGTGGSGKVIADRHGFSEGILRDRLPRFCRLLRRHFSGLFALPTGQRLVEVIEGFREINGMPQCAGAINGTHIPWRPPRWITTDYKNRKGWTSIGLQLMVDARGYIMDARTGHPGTWHDAKAFRNSTVGKAILSGEWPNGPGEVLMGTETRIRPYVLADAAYPGSSRLVKPFPGDMNVMPRFRREFNYKQSGTRMPVEHVNGRLKRRWRFLMYTSEIWYIDDMVNIIMACCLLHNLCLLEGFDGEGMWPEDLDDMDDEFDMMDDEPGNDMPRRDDDRDDEGDLDGHNAVQQALAEYIS